MKEHVYCVKLILKIAVMKKKTNQIVMMTTMYKTSKLTLRKRDLRSKEVKIRL
jgi:hypothetical protein